MPRYCSEIEPRPHPIRYFLTQNNKFYWQAENKQGGKIQQLCVQFLKGLLRKFVSNRKMDETEKPNNTYYVYAWRKL